jgi:hypothetical protein
MYILLHAQLFSIHVGKSILSKLNTIVNSIVCTSTHGLELDATLDSNIQTTTLALDAIFNTTQVFQPQSSYVLEWLHRTKA